MHFQNSTSSLTNRYQYALECVIVYGNTRLEGASQAIRSISQSAQASFTQRFWKLSNSNLPTSQLQSTTPHVLIWIHKEIFEAVCGAFSLDAMWCQELQCSSKSLGTQSPHVGTSISKSAKQQPVVFINFWEVGHFSIPKFRFLNNHPNFIQKKLWTTFWSHTGKNKK